MFITFTWDYIPGFSNLALFEHNKYILFDKLRTKISVFNNLCQCGLYCGACPHYQSSFSGKEYLLFNAKVKEKKKYTCRGCRSEKLYIHAGCAECKIRRCCQNKKIEHCGICKELPCELLIEFINDGHEHHLNILTELKEMNRSDLEVWPENKKKEWTCKCGHELTWLDKECHNCNKKTR